MLERDKIEGVAEMIDRERNRERRQRDQNRNTDRK
jgi:hypothetical protein